MTSNQAKEIVILGAGIAGISAAYHTQKTRHPGMDCPDPDHRDVQLDITKIYETITL